MPSSNSLRGARSRLATSDWLRELREVLLEEPVSLSRYEVTEGCSCTAADPVELQELRTLGRGAVQVAAMHNVKTALLLTLRQ